MDITGFKLDEELCTGCRSCAHVCPSHILALDEGGKARMADGKDFSWYGCWQCQHCLAVCPQGAISILGLRSEDSLSLPAPRAATPLVDALVAGRRSCRNYRDEDVDAAMVNELLEMVQNAPTGGNKRMVEYTLLDDKAQTAAFERRLFAGMERLAAAGVYPVTFDKASYDQMKTWRPQPGAMLLCGAPHLFIPHAPKRIGCTVQDVNIAAAYFELLCAARGLGAVFMTFPLRVLDLLPEVYALLGIPEDHYVSMAVGFGYPSVRYARGAQRGKPVPVHRPKIV